MPRGGALHAAMLSGRSEWMHNESFRQLWWGAYASARGQKRIMNMAIAADANVAVLLQFISQDVHFGGEPAHHPEDQPVHNSWEVLGRCVCVSAETRCPPTSFERAAPAHVEDGVGGPVQCSSGA